MEKTKETLVVNLFAGPGAGKTTCAWEIASELKKCGFEAEYVSEYAKEFVWDNKPEMLDGSVENQRKLYAEQARRVNRLIGKVDVVVTDSPALLSAMYLKTKDTSFENEMLNDFASKNNFNIFIERGSNFQPNGRIHTFAQSCKVDNSIKQFLSDNNIPYELHEYSTISSAINSLITTLTHKDLQRKNQGYKIIDSKTIGKSEIVLGAHEKGNQFVTWELTAGKPDDYYWGHYFTDKATATKNFHDRISKKLEFYIDSGLSIDPKDYDKALPSRQQSEHKRSSEPGR